MPLHTLTSEQFEVRFPVVHLTDFEREIAKELWDHIGGSLEDCEQQEGDVARQLRQVSERVQQAVMRAAALRAVGHQQDCATNPFERQ